MPLQATSGAASYDAFGGGVAAVPNYIEDVFSTYLYTGNGSTQTITNGIDLSTKGGLVWFKNRNTVDIHALFDSQRPLTNYLRTNGTNAEATATTNLAFNTSGFSLNNNFGFDNTNGDPYVSWTFREAPKFFDVVTFTTDSTGAATVSHALGSTPAFVIVKRTDSTGLWLCWHTSLPSTNYYLFLNLTNAQTNSGGTWLTPSSTQVSFPSNTSTGALDSSASYVMYVYASNAGGFGLTGTDNVISCGSYTAAASAVTVNLGYEPQWVMVKSATNAANWLIIDTMRGAPNTTAGSGWANLYPNTSGAEQNFYSMITPTATGFIVDQNVNQSSLVNGSGTYIYIAIRRGPMKVPTSGTSVFSAQTGTYSAGDSLSVGFPADMYIDAWRTGTLYKANYSRLVNFANSNSSASQNYLKTNTTDAEVTTSQAPSLYDLWNTTAKVGSWNQGVSEVWWMFRRAPSFFDEVCYTSTTHPMTVNHNLNAVPELIIIKPRNSTSYGWITTSAGLTNPDKQYVRLNLTDAQSTAGANNFIYNRTTTTFTLGAVLDLGAGEKWVAYLFATCAGVSKVGSYTGTGATQTIDCGFTGGARFVLIKRTDSTGDWYVWDSARGIVAGNDPYLLLNSTAAEVTSTDYVDTYSAGFEISSTAPAAINASGGSFIFFAVA